MSGHSKWANIQHRKGRQDARRGKLFSQLIREVTVAARLGGADPAGNPRLRSAIDNALSRNMSKDTIRRAIGRGAEGGDDQDLEEVRYEGYGPGGTALLITCLTDNRNRTVAELRHALSKHGGNLGEDGSAAYLFSKQGLLCYGEETDEEQLLEQALEAGAEDVNSSEQGGFEVLTGARDLATVQQKLQDAGLPAEESSLIMRPNTTVTVTGAQAEKMLHLVAALEELDDVQQVWCNADIPDQALNDSTGA